MVVSENGSRYINATDIYYVEIMSHKRIFHNLTSTVLSGTCLYYVVLFIPKRLKFRLILELFVLSHLSLCYDVLIGFAFCLQKC